MYPRVVVVYGDDRKGGFTNVRLQILSNMSYGEFVV